MAQVIVILKIMPENVEVELDNLKQKITKVVEHFKGQIDNIDIEDIAFGLKSLIFKFMIDDSETDSDVVEDNIRNIEGVGSVQVRDVRRAIG